MSEIKCRISAAELEDMWWNADGDAKESLVIVTDAIVADLNAQIAERQEAMADSDKYIEAQALALVWYVDEQPFRKVIRYVINAVRAQYNAAPAPQPTPAPSRGDAAWEAVERHKLQWRFYDDGTPFSRIIVIDKDSRNLGMAQDLVTAIERALEVLERKAESE